MKIIRVTCKDDAEEDAIYKIENLAKEVNKKFPPQSEEGIKGERTKPFGAGAFLVKYSSNSEKNLLNKIDKFIKDWSSKNSIVQSRGKSRKGSESEFVLLYSFK